MSAEHFGSRRNRAWEFWCSCLRSSDIEIDTDIGGIEATYAKADKQGQQRRTWKGNTGYHRLLSMHIMNALSINKRKDKVPSMIAALWVIESLCVTRSESSVADRDVPYRTHER